MRIDLLNLDKFVTMYELPEVKTSSLFNSKNRDVDPDGLASYEIFGRPGTEGRKKNFAYIELCDTFIHPHAFDVLTKVQRTIKSCVYGEGEFFVDHGALVRYKEGMKIGKREVGTGIKFLQKIYDQLDFRPKEMDAQATSEKKKLLYKLKKEEVFITKFPVIPPFYRDVDMSNSKKSKKNIINSMYMKLINNASMIKNSNNLMDMFGTSGSHKVIQDTLNEIHGYFLNVICGVHGFFHKHAMGKATDFSARCVISGPRYDVDSTEDAEVSFEHVAVPLSVVVKIFAPFICYGVKNIINGFIKGRETVWYYNKKSKKAERVRLAPNWMQDFTTDAILDKINLFYNSVDHRLDKVYIRGENGEQIPLSLLSEDTDKVIETDEEIEDAFFDDLSGQTTVHPITLVELFYMAAEDTVYDKCVYCSRFPIEDYNGIYPSMFNTIPCEVYKPRKINNKIYKRFPDVSVMRKGTNIRRYFIDTLRLFSPMLAMLDADFDGDVLSIYSVFTKEANEAAKKQMKSLSHIMNIKGSGSTKEIPEVAKATLYALTYRKKVV